MSKLQRRLDRARSATEAAHRTEHRGAAGEVERDLGREVVDLIADLLHYVDRNGHNPEAVLRIAERHFEAERPEPPAEGSLAERFAELQREVERSEGTGDHRQADEMKADLNEDALNAIQGELDGAEWSPERIEAVASIIRSTGRPVRDIDESPDLYAMVVVVEGAEAQSAWRGVAKLLEGDEATRYVGAPWGGLPKDATEFDTDAVRLGVTYPVPCICTERDDPSDHRRDCPMWRREEGAHEHEKRDLTPAE